MGNLLQKFKEHAQEKQRRRLFSAVAGGQLEEIRAVLDDGLFVDTPNHNLWTALHQAAMQNNPAPAALLLERGADPNARNVLGRTPLHNAVISRNTDIVRLLVQGGADSDMPDAEGKPPIYYATPEMRGALAEVLHTGRRLRAGRLRHLRRPHGGGVHR